MPTITPTSGAWESLTDDQRAWLVEVAIACKAYVAVDRPGSALRAIVESCSDADDYVGLWSILDSKVRAAIKEVENPKVKHETGEMSQLWAGSKKVYRAK